MKFYYAVNAVAQRLPGKRYLRILKECVALCRQFPRTPVYKTVLKLNVRAYFCIRPHYGPFWCREAKPGPCLYHITERANLPSIYENGLQNSKTGLIFLTGSPKLAHTRAVKKRLRDPVLLCIDSERMCRDEVRFYVNQEWNQIWIVQSVPVQYISEDESL